MLAAASRPGAAEAPAPPGAAEPTAPASRPNVVIYLVDTLRPDRLGTYGHTADTSPHLDAFAAEATVFENALAQAPWTRPSVASLFTGLSPLAHGVNRGYSRLPDDSSTVAELFDAAGYDTVGLITNAMVAHKLGFSQGFDSYRLTSPAESVATRVVGLFEEWLGSRRGEAPFFAYLHTYEPHGPYEPPAELRRRFGAGDDGWIGSLAHLKRLSRGDIEAGEGEVEELLRLYDAEIRWNDEGFGRLIALLRERELLDETVVVFTSDHGEAFREHGTWQHGKVLYREVLGVPLVIRFPDRGHGARVAAPVQLVDLLPTLTAAAGLDTPPGLAGRDLGALLAADADAEAEIVGYVDRGGGYRATSLTTAEWRMIEPSSATSGFAPELYEWTRDPGERHDLAAGDPILTGWLRARLAKLRAREVGTLAAEEVELGAEIESRLRAMGYLD